MTPADFQTIRKSLSLTQAQLAEEMGVKPRTIWGLENQTGEIPRLYALALTALAKDWAAE